MVDRRLDPRPHGVLIAAGWSRRVRRCLELPFADITAKLLGEHRHANVEAGTLDQATNRSMKLEINGRIGPRRGMALDVPVRPHEPQRVTRVRGRGRALRDGIVLHGLDRLSRSLRSSDIGHGRCRSAVGSLIALCGLLTGSDEVYGFDGGQSLGIDGRRGIVRR